jgi:hypothetical protein
MYLAEMIEIYHVDEKSSFELDRLVQMYSPQLTSSQLCVCL